MISRDTHTLLQKTFFMWIQKYPSWSIFRIGDILSKAKVDKHFIIFLCFGGIFPKQNLFIIILRQASSIILSSSQAIFKIENNQYRKSYGKLSITMKVIDFSKDLHDNLENLLKVYRDFSTK